MINIRSNKFLLKSIEGVIFDKDGTITDPQMISKELSITLY